MRPTDWLAEYSHAIFTMSTLAGSSVSVMSAVGHCADNAACEGFFGMLKRERVHHRRYRTRDEARADLFDYLERLRFRLRQRLTFSPSSAGHACMRGAPITPRLSLWISRIRSSRRALARARGPGMRHAQA